MSIKNCIDSAVSQGVLTLEEGQALQKRFDRLFRELNSRGAARQQLIDELTAEAAEKRRLAALTETRRKIVSEAILSHRNAKGEVDPADALRLLLENDGGGKMDDVEHRRLVILGQAHAELDALLWAFKKGAISGDLRRKGLVTGEVKARLDNVVRELFGEKTGDKAAAELAQAWSRVSDDMRTRFNAAGGAIRKLDSWGLPQHHDALALLNVGMHEWRRRIKPVLDRDKMVSQLTGHRLTDEELDEALESTWHAITSAGWSRREPSGASVGKGALFRQHQDHRFLHFKDADSWLKYQRDFGEGDPFAAMMGHVSVMARDIAHMEILGPNPEAMLTYLKQLVESNAARVKPAEAVIKDLQDALARVGTDRSDELLAIVARIDAARAAMGKAPVYQHRASPLDLFITVLQEALRDLRNKRMRDPAYRDEWQAKLEAAIAENNALLDAIGVDSDRISNELTAARNNRALIVAPPGKSPIDRARSGLARVDAMWDVMRGSYNAPVNSRVANTLATTRNLVSASALGSASISAISDVAFGLITRNFVGLKRAGVTDVIGETIGAMSRGTREEAVRAGLIMNSALHVMHSQARYSGAINSKAMSGYLVDRVLTLSGLTAWTQAGKHAFGMAMQAEFADRVALDFAGLPRLLRETLERNGMDGAQWDVIRAAQLHEPQVGSARLLRPMEIADRDIGQRYHAMILRETRYAVPEGNVRSQSFLTFGRPGTLVGELGRNFAQFKSFGVAVVLLHGSRIAREIGAGRGARGAGYAGALLITGSMFAALAIQLKELSQGRDPRSMDSPGFWGAAILQSGGMGIYGDFLFGDLNRFGGGLTSTIAGPVAGRIDTLRNSTIGNVVGLADSDENPNLGRDVVKAVKDWTPGGSLWWARLAYERVVLDQMQMMLDPDGHRALARKVAKRERDFGNSFWWAPGEAEPSRAPDLGGAFGGP